MEVEELLLELMVYYFFTVVRVKLCKQRGSDLVSEVELVVGLFWEWSKRKIYMIT